MVAVRPHPLHRAAGEMTFFFLAVGAMLAAGCGDRTEVAESLDESSDPATVDGTEQPEPGADPSRGAVPGGTSPAGEGDAARPSTSDGEPEADARGEGQSSERADPAADGDANSDARSPDGIDEQLLERLARPAYPPAIYPEENPFSEEKALLGKILFWEEQLSADGTVACGTCHRAAAGGSDPRAVHSPGLDGVSNTDDDVQGSPGIRRCDADGTRTGDAPQLTGRRASNYLDAMFAPNLFWDGRAECRHEGCPSETAFEDPDAPGTFPIARGGALESQAVMPPLSDVEMACEQATWPGIHERLATATPLSLARDVPPAMASFIAAHDGSYPAMFATAFGDEQTSGPPDEINTRRIAFAIATHERQLTSDQTPWDAFNAGDRDALTPAQIRGYVFFRTAGGCGGCHAEPLFTAHQFHFTGFYPPPWDEGRSSITLNDNDRGKMRTPSLRNVALRLEGGLLHNGGGRGLSLESIVETYAAGGLRDDPSIAAVPISPSVTGFLMSEAEKADLIDFLTHALTDPRVANEEPPFDRPTLGSEP